MSNVTSLRPSGAFHRDVLDPRRAGQVSRYHTWPRHRDQSIAEHSWQVVRILLAIWPEAPRETMVHAMLHDIGEVAVGDLPYPVKRENPALKDAVDELENACHLAMCHAWSVPPPRRAHGEELAVLKLAHAIEMWEWGLYEVGLGNVYAQLVADRCWALIQEASGPVPAAVQLRASQYVGRRQRQEGLV